MESRMSILCNKLKNYPVELNRWSKNKFGHTYQSLKKLSMQLKTLQTNESPRHREEIHKLHRWTIFLSMKTQNGSNMQNSTGTHMGTKTPPISALGPLNIDRRTEFSISMMQLR
jgi:hypothetical protein